MHTHCDCKPLICGPHLIKPCRVIAIKQVSVDKTNRQKRFIVQIPDSSDGALFVSLNDLRPLLAYWGLDEEKIGAAPTFKPRGRSED